VRAFQSSAGLPPTGRLDTETVKALGSSDTNVAYSAPVSAANEAWMPVTKFKHGRWIVKWKKSHRPVAGEDGDEDRQVNSDAAWNPYNHD
jgi:peptidoglycan hydrolase-like protein with peptidoglycan-binding domain